MLRCSSHYFYAKMPNTNDCVQYTTKPLYKHQTEAVHIGKRALDMHGGVLIADEMGLGKTLMAMHLFLAKMRKNRNKNKSTKILVVAPSSVLIEWQYQLTTHINRDLFPEDLCQIVSYSIQGNCTLNAEKRKERLHEWFTDHNVSYIVLASYGTIRNDASFVLRKKWHYVVMDECHQLKNQQSTTNQMFQCYLRSKSKRIGISGTPNANQPVRDLCALAKILFPDVYELHDEENYKTQKPSVLQNLIIRRTLKDVGLSLPSLHIRHISLSLPKDSPEWNAYNDQLDKTMKALFNYIKSKRYKNTNCLIALRVYQCELNMLGKVCTHYQISEVCHKTIAPEDAVCSIKEKYVQKQIQDYAILHQQKLIVTSASSTFLKIIHTKNDARHTVLFTGETRQAERQSVLNKWRSASGPNVLLLSMKAGGVGLTLVEASRMICVDGLSQSNPAIRDQVMKRIHRMGQTKTVYIDDLCTMGTIDEVMKEVVHPSKRRMANRLLQKLPVLEGKGTRKTRVDELCSIGNILYPTWQKRNKNDVSTHSSETVENEVVFKYAQQKKIHNQDSRSIKRKRSGVLQLPRIKKKKRTKSNL